MSLGYIGFVNPPQTVVRPSPSLWADCLNTILKDKAFGLYMSADFDGIYQNASATTLATGILASTGAGTSTFGKATTATFGPRVLSMAISNADNDNNAIFFEELGFALANPASGNPGTIVRNSGNKVWFEASVAPGSTLGDAAFFVGLASRAAVTAATGPIADNPATSGAADILSSATGSGVGFITVEASSAIATVNALYKKTTATSVTVASNVGNSTAFTGSSTTSNSALFAGGIPTGLTAPGNLALNTFVNYGLRFDGYTTLEFYVNGVIVAKQTIDSTFDQATLFVPVVAQKTGTTTARTIDVAFVRAAYQDRY